ncbi:oligosaccharide flippase family protein [bacterium]|nr:oligosaccharide flippase family protein [bacterium]
MVYLVKGGSWLTLGQMVSAICSFLLALAFANLLPKETYGIYKYVLSMASLLAISTLPGIDTAIIQAISRGYEGSLIKGLKTKICWGILGGLASLGLAGYYYFNGNTTLTISFLVIAAFLPLMDSFNIYRAVLSGRKLFNIQVKYSILIRFFSVAALIIALFLTKNLFLILFIYFLSYTLFRFIFLITTLKKFSLNTKEDPRTISYGKHLTIMGIINTLANYLDKILIFHYLGAAQLAIYSFAVIPPEQLKSFLKNIRTLALPKLSVRPKAEIKATIFSKMFKFALFITVGTVIYIFLAPTFYRVLFPQYIESILYSQILSISLIAVVVALPNVALQAKIAKKQLYQLNICTSFIRIGLLFLFIHIYGLLGIILARVIGRFINLTITCWLVKKI